MQKAKEKKERYSHLNTEFQRIARRDMKAFLSDQCKEIEENNRMGKTRDCFKKIRDTGREAGGGIRMGNTFKSMADSCQCMAKTTTIL